MTWTLLIIITSAASVDIIKNIPDSGVKVQVTPRARQKFVAKSKPVMVKVVAMPKAKMDVDLKASMFIAALRSTIV